jgi:hypothetical protein
MGYLNGSSQPQFQTSDSTSILLHLVDGVARIETRQSSVIEKLDHTIARMDKLEAKQQKPPRERRPLSEYLPVASGIGLLAAVLTGKLSVLQLVAALKGGG